MGNTTPGVRGRASRSGKVSCGKIQLFFDKRGVGNVFNHTDFDMMLNVANWQGYSNRSVSRLGSCLTSNLQVVIH
ncbi:hypothetical protein HMF3257_12575 [Spirosoma telluris]|uniref:Uncharacterized protein n=1 Tax=Spirosoma telluris TaxID=2183553 RepID=A0A327NJ36_9BACT|nr:hypothetical protein HMF3257_12575 [Spirosoma telluris]